MTTDAKPLSDEEILELQEWVATSPTVQAVTPVYVVGNPSREFRFVDLLATITTLQSQLREAAAREAVLVGALEFYQAAGPAWKSQVYAHKEGISWWPSDALMADQGIKADRALTNPTPAARALLDELEGLRREVVELKDLNIGSRLQIDKVKARAETAEAALRELKK